MLNCITAIIPLLDILPRCRSLLHPPDSAAAHAPMAPNEPAWRDLRGNKRLCAGPPRDPHLHAPHRSPSPLLPKP